MEKGKRVLVVEDEPFLGRTLQRYFTRKGCDVRWATSLAEASSSAREGGWNLVLLDRFLPDGAGASLLPELRKNSGAAILMMTGESGAEAPDGVDGLIQKPFDLPALESAVKSLRAAR